MSVKAVLSTLVIFCVFICATKAASQPSSQPWLAVMTYPCRRVIKTCIGVVLDDHWVLTTASCFSKCSRIEPPLQVSVYVNIPPAVQGRLASSVRMGSKVNGSLVWQHPDFNSSTFANNLALVQLGCHHHTLEKLSLATNCSLHGDQQIKFNGYVFAKKSVIKLRNTKTDKAKCFSKESTGTWYHLDSTLQMLTTTLKSSCMETSICSNSARLISVMQENNLNCTETLPFTTLAPVTHTDVKINDTVPKPIIIDDSSPIIKPVIIHPATSQLISATSVEILNENTATSTEVPEISSSSHVASSTIFPSISTEVSETSSTAQVTTLTEIPAETSTSAQVSISIKPLPTEAPTSTTSTELPIATEAPTSTLTEIPTETSALTPVSASTKSSSTEAPTSIVISHSVSAGRIPTQAPVKIQASSSSEIPKASTSTLLETQVATSTKMQTTTDALTPSIMPTPTSTEISTSTPVSSSSLTSSSVVSDTSTIITPTKTPTSGCQLSIENGVATPFNMPGFLIITYTCNVGYRFKSGTRPITLGCTNGEMVAKPPPCELIACPPVEPIANGRVVVSGSGLGDSATYSCNEGYILFDGYTVRRCTENLEWTGNVGICKRACPIPSALVCNDGQKILPSAFKYGRIGDSASYQSKQGYAVIGEPPVCQPDSTWTTPPKCLKLCNEKEVIANAEIVIHRNASSYTRTIMCNDGYEAVGFAEQRCTSSGLWTPYFQECKKTCSSIALDKGIVEMRKSPSFMIALMECEEGFHLEPPIKAVVCMNGQWSPGVPRCVEDK